MDSERFLQDFFGPGNRLQLGQIPPDFSSWLQPWMDRVKNRRFPIFLPRWTADRSMVWYAAASSPGAAAELQELITAFIGPSYAIFAGRLAILQGGDPVDQAAAAFLGAVIYKFVVPNREDAPAVRANLDRLRILLEVRPAEMRQLSRPVGRILRDFELALVAGDDQLSEHLIDEIRARGHLNAANLSFLEVARMAELDDWDGVLGHPNLPRLIEMRRPTHVTAALIEAVYRRFLARYEASGDVSGAVAAMRDVIMPRYGPLFEGLPLVGPYATRALLLLCLASDAVPVRAARQLLADIRGTSDSFLQILATALETSVKTDGIDTVSDVAADAQSLIGSGQMQLALSLLTDSKPSIGRTAMMVHCAYELNSLASARLAAAAVDAVNPDDLELLPQTRQFHQMLAAIRESVGGKGGQESPRNWAGWFHRVDTDTECHPYARSWAQGGADEWDVAEFDDAGAVESIVDHLGHGQDAVVAIQRDALPYLLRSIGSVPHELSRRVYMQVLDTLLYRGAQSRAELQTILDVLEATLGDLAPTDYRRVVSDLVDIWAEVQAPASLEWAMQLLDLLIVQPCRDSAARERLAVAVLGAARVHVRRLNVAIRLTLNDLVRDLELPPELELPATTDEDHVDPLAVLRGQRVAIYTLTEGAGLRARDRLAHWTQRRVELLSDKVCTEALRAAAREADLFVMVTRSAKHAATDCIKAHRPDAKPLVTTAGKGSSSVMYAVRALLAVG